MDKEVYFDQYCPSCKHSDKKGYEDPCYECLSEPMNRDSHKPIEFEEKE